ncbi:MAG TPA: hypothetical protein PKE13_08240, partial [Hyphomicrobium zavarzinii]|nr:hypothetical protein [Hyphomicrobium zavarzinii]
EISRLRQRNQRLTWRMWVETDLSRTAVGLMMDVGSALRAEGVRKNLPAFGYALKGFKHSLRQGEACGRNPHRHSERAA